MDYSRRGPAQTTPAQWHGASSTQSLPLFQQFGGEWLGQQAASQTPRQDINVHHLPSSQGTIPRGAQCQSSVQMSQMSQSRTYSAADYATKEAEVAVLRSRLQQFERENMRLRTDLVAAKDQKHGQDRRLQSELERVQSELRYAKQDIFSAEQEQKRLKTSLQSAQAELTEQAAATASKGSSAAALPPIPTIQATVTSPAFPQVDVQSCEVGRLAETRPTGQGKQWQHEVLLRELSSWETTSQMIAMPADDSTGWFKLYEGIRRLTTCERSQDGAEVQATEFDGVTVDIATAVTGRIRAAGARHHWLVVKCGARVVQVWIGLYPSTVSELIKPEALPNERVSSTMPSQPTLFEALANVLHAAVLDGCRSDSSSSGKATAILEDSKERQACTSQLLVTLLEIASRLPPPDLVRLMSILSRPSLCALLATGPCCSSLHLPCMSLLQALVANPELFALAHQAESHENPLLAAANLLVIPSIPPRQPACGEAASVEVDGQERQECRIAALQIFCNCLCTAPRLDIVLQLRGAPTNEDKLLDTVLQRVAFLCHHELLCLGIHGSFEGPLREASHQRCTMRHQQSIDLAMMILSSFAWHTAPWTLDMKSPNHDVVCAEACAALGRMRPLLGSIVDMVERRAPQSKSHERWLTGVSALRMLLVHADGEDGTANNRESLVGSDKPADVVSVVID